MKKFSPYILPVLGLCLFIAIMFSGKYLKEPLRPSEDVMGFVKTAMQDTVNEKWDNVSIDINNIEKAWKKIVPRIQFSVERDEIYNIGINIARLKGANMTKDKSSILMELNEFMENWDELTK